VKFKLYATPPLLEAAMTVLQTVAYHGPHLYRPQNGKGCGSCMGVLLMSRLVAAADCVRTDVISWSQYRAASRVRGRHFDVGRRLLADGRRRPPTHHAHWTDVCRRLLRRSDPRQPRLSRRPPGDLTVRDWPRFARAGSYNVSGRVRENVCNNSKNVESHVFLIFKKNVKHSV